MKVDILAIGNAGFRIEAGGRVVFVDAFYHAAPWVGSAPAFRAEDFDRADLILVTHSHADHFNEEETADLARRTAASVVASAGVGRRLRGRMEPGRIIVLEPPGVDSSGKAVGMPGPEGSGVMAFRTSHASDHNSYLVDVQGFRFFHDGDNEDTAMLSPARFGRLDVLFIGPWQGSGWPGFVAECNVSRWFVMHLTRDELDEHDRGRFFDGLCDRVPDRLVALRPGQRYEMEVGD